jgi:nucleoside phosphorylase
MPEQSEIQHQLQLLEIHRRTLNYLIKQAAYHGGESMAPPLVFHQILEARNNIQRIKVILRWWGQFVEDKPDDEAPNDTPFQGPLAQDQPIDEGATMSNVNPTTLLDMIDKYFNISELQTICFDLGIDYENLGGQSKIDKARELILYADRYGRTADLITHLKQARPFVDWGRMVKPSLDNQAPKGRPAPQSPSTNIPQEQTSPTDFVIITTLDEERDALLAHLPNPKQLPPSTTDIRIYYQAQLPTTPTNGATATYNIIVTSPLGMGRVQASTATSDAIRRWQPRYVMLVGIAGGVAAKGVRLGDILVSDQIVDYELQKTTPEVPEIRWDVQRADPRLLNAVRNFKPLDWHKRINTWRPDPNQPTRHIGPIASGDKVIAFGEALARYRSVWSTLIGVEMEAAGAATAVFQAAQPPGFFMVRCVSDLADEEKGKPDVERWRAYACEAAAAYTVALLQSGPV